MNRKNASKNLNQSFVYQPLLTIGHIIPAQFNRFQPIQLLIYFNIDSHRSDGPTGEKAYGFNDRKEWIEAGKIKKHGISTAYTQEKPLI